MPKNRTHSLLRTDADDARLINSGNNCLSCARFSRCSNPNKQWQFVCEKFRNILAPPAEKSRERQRDKKPLIKLQPIIIPSKGETDAASTLDFQRMIERTLAQENNSPLPPDLKVDDGDLPLAANFLEFATGKQFLGIRPFAKQIEAAVHLFAEWCPRCSDKDYAYNIPKRAAVDNYDAIRDRITFLEFGRCPKCRVRKSELYRQRELKIPVELAGLAGQRSGKSAGSVMISAYTLHRFLKLPNASQAFGLLDTDELQATFVAQTWQKATEKLYSPLFNYIQEKPWFQQYHAMLDHYSEHYGEQLYRVNNLFASYRVRKLLIRPAGPDKRKLRGDTSFLATIDELGWFDASEGSEKKVKQSASEIYTAIRNSFRTLRSAYYKLLRQGFDNIPPPIFCNISSPSSKRDQMVKTYERSKTSKYIFGFHYASWEFNPTLSKRDFEDDFAVDEARAWRDFGAVPPNSSLPYIADIDDLTGIVDKSLRNTVFLSPRTVIAGNGREMVSGKLRFHTTDQNKRIMAIDAGYSGNSFAIVAGYMDSEHHRPVFDTMIELQPLPDCPINHNDLYENVLVPLTEKLNVKLLVSDRWQNIKLLHDAEAELGVETEQYSVKYADFEALRQDVYENLITIPKPEMKKSLIEKAGETDYPYSFARTPIAHLIFQALTVRDLQGKSVEKGDGTTDDILRALVLCYSFVTDSEYEEYCTGKSNAGRGGNPFAGVWASRSGGGSSGNFNGGVVSGSHGPIGVVASFGANRR